MESGLVVLEIKGDGMGIRPSKVKFLCLKKSAMEIAEISLRRVYMKKNKKKGEKGRHDILDGGIGLSRIVFWRRLAAASGRMVS